MSAVSMLSPRRNGDDTFVDRPDRASCLIGERLVRLHTVPILLADHVSGRKPSLGAVYRWVKKGVRGVHLETVRLPWGLATSVEAVERFIEAQSRCDVRTVALTPARRRRHESIEMRAPSCDPWHDRDPGGAIVSTNSTLVSKTSGATAQANPVAVHPAPVTPSVPLLVVRARAIISPLGRKEGGGTAPGDELHRSDHQCDPQRGRPGRHSAVRGGVDLERGGGH